MTVVGGGPAQANLFEIETPSGASAGNSHATAMTVGARARVLVVVFGPARGNVTVVLRGGPATYTGATRFHPGMGAVRVVPPMSPTGAPGGVASITVALSHGDPHGCAVVRLVGH